MKGLLLCLAATVLSAKCDTACVYEGYDKGAYNEKLKACECVTIISADILLGKKFTLQKSRKIEENY